MEPDNKTSILIIYTGGTIGMIKDLDTGILLPFEWNLVSRHIPELQNFDYQIDCITIDPVVDSSNMNPDRWVELAKHIEKNYEEYDGFVILHGSDTMSYTASALSFMLKNLNKPIIFTGSQLPIGVNRTDGKENLITSVEIGKYLTSVQLGEIGVISGQDITTEAAITKLMFLLGKGYSKTETEQLLLQSLRGELTSL